jgi:hypothetical protein
LQGGIFKGRAYYDGSGDYLSLADSTDWDFGSGGFNVKIKLSVASLAKSHNIYSQSKTDSIGPVRLDVDVTTGKLHLYASTNGSTWGLNVLGNTALSVGTSYDIELKREGDIFTVLLNGTTTATGTLSGALYNAAQSLFIGRLNGYPEYDFNGHMSSYEVIKNGTTVLNLKFNEALGATTFIDDTGKTVTTNGNVVIVAQSS